MHFSLWFDLGAIFLLILLNGFFAMSELAILSARAPRLRALVKKQVPGAMIALDLREHPGRFLSTVQIGITLVAIVAGAYSGSNLSEPAAHFLRSLGVPAAYAPDMGLVLVIIGTTYASLVIGELIPKQLALMHAERIACVVAPVMFYMARLAAPFAFCLDKTSGALFRLIGFRRDERPKASFEELHLAIADARHTGAIEEDEQAMISGTIRFIERPVRAIMTPRGDVDWLDVDATPQEIAHHLAQTSHTRIPVGEGSIDAIIGVVQARDLLAAALNNKIIDLRALMRQSPVVPDMIDATDALAILQSAEVPLALVNDEYGHMEGIVTPANFLSAIAGHFTADIPSDFDPPAVRRTDDSWLLSGSLPADEMAEHLGIALEGGRDFHTAAGYVLDRLRRIPTTGDRFDSDGWLFEIADMDGKKIDKILATPAQKDGAAQNAESD